MNFKKVSQLVLTTATLAVTTNMARSDEAAPTGSPEDKALWQKLDITQDGWLDGKELDGGWDKFDFDEDGEVTQKEFLSGRLEERNGTSTPEEADAQIFTTLDTSANGYLSGKELDGGNARAFDANSDKRVTLDEFLAGRAKARAAASTPAAKPAAAVKPATTTKPAPAPKAALPAPAVASASKINGLFFMTRFWSGSGTLEKATWYFAPDGKYYHDLTTGFSPAELAAFDGDKGTYQVAGGKMTITGKNGEKTESEIEPSQNVWYWNGGLFVAVTPFQNAAELAGSYEGGESSVYAGNVATISKTLQLRADGTFSWDGLASFKVKGETTEDTNTAGESALAGKWNLSGYVLTLTAGNGEITQGITFPYDNEKTPIKPDRFFFAGTMYKKQ